jgi:hypothetical protein
MAHQSTSIPIRTPRNEPISWPNAEETMPRALPDRTASTASQSSFSADEQSLRAIQGKISDAATSLAHSVRRFADERPLYFVGIVASAALVAGVALRIWRSNSHA